MTWRDCKCEEATPHLAEMERIPSKIVAMVQASLRDAVVDLCRRPASELAGYYQLSLRGQSRCGLSHTRSRRRKLAAAIRLSPTRFVEAMSDVWRRGPGGTTDNSPAFQRRVRATNQPRPVGTPELAVVVPSTSRFGNANRIFLRNSLPLDCQKIPIER